MIVGRRQSPYNDSKVEWPREAISAGDAGLDLYVAGMSQTGWLRAWEAAETEEHVVPSNIYESYHFSLSVLPSLAATTLPSALAKAAIAVTTGGMPMIVHSFMSASRRRSETCVLS